MADTLYRISDEPRPGALERFVTDPNWALFGLMLGGAWLAFPWFVFNAVALGSATLRKELGLAVLGFVGAWCLAFGLRAFVRDGTLPQEWLPYLMILPIVWKLGIGYALLMIQRRSFDLWEHYGGQPRQAFVVLVAGFLLRGVFRFEDPLWMSVLLW